MRPPTSDEQIAFLVKLQRLLDEGAFVAWYKFALLLALADLSIEHGDDAGEGHTQSLGRSYATTYQPRGPYRLITPEYALWPPRLLRLALAALTPATTHWRMISCSEARRKVAMMWSRRRVIEFGSSMSIPCVTTTRRAVC